MSRHTWRLGASLLAGLAAALLSGNACLLQPDARYCTADDHCGPGQICDVNGTTPASGGHGNTCVAAAEACSPACANPTPVCADMTCRGCMHASECPSAQPVCNEQGACVECMVHADCPGEMQVCSPEGMCMQGLACTENNQCPLGQVCRPSGSCGPCTEHGQCDTAICDERGGVGTCEDTHKITYVSADTGTDNDACGDMNVPCRSIKFALGRGKEWIRAYPGTYADRLDIGTGKRVRIVGDSDVTQVTIQPGVAVSGAGTEVYLDTLTIQGATGAIASGVSCTGSARLHLYRVRVTGGMQGAGGVSAASQCDLTMERTMVQANSGKGVLIDNAAFTLRNNVLMSNGSLALERRSSRPGQRAILEFNTIVNNNLFQDTGGLSCDAHATASHNIITNGASSALDEAGGCFELDPALDFSLVRVRDPGGSFGLAGDGYHLTEDSQAVDRGSPSRTDMKEDFDGDPRPSRGIVDIGADELFP